MSETNDAKLDHVHGSLSGASGGQLEYVSQQIQWRLQGGAYVPGILIRFTDHDVQAYEDGEKCYYELWFPVCLQTGELE